MDNQSTNNTPHVIVYIYNEPNFNKESALSWVKGLGIPSYKVTAFSLTKDVIFISFSGSKENIEKFITAATLAYSNTAHREFICNED